MDRGEGRECLPAPLEGLELDMGEMGMFDFEDWEVGFLAGERGVLSLWRMFVAMDVLGVQRE